MRDNCLVPRRVYQQLLWWELSKSRPRQELALPLPAGAQCLTYPQVTGGRRAWQQRYNNVRWRVHVLGQGDSDAMQRSRAVLRGERLARSKCEVGVILQWVRGYATQFLPEIYHTQP